MTIAFGRGGGVTSGSVVFTGGSEGLAALFCRERLVEDRVHVKTATPSPPRLPTRLPPLPTLPSPGPHHIASRMTNPALHETICTRSDKTFSCAI